MAETQPNNPAPNKPINPQQKPQLSLKEYLAKKEKEAANAQKRKMPLPVKIILAIPLIAICGFGIFLIPYIIYQIIVGMTGK